MGSLTSRLGGELDCVCVLCAETTDGAWPRTRAISMDVVANQATRSRRTSRMHSGCQRAIGPQRLMGQHWPEVMSARVEQGECQLTRNW